MTCERKHFYNLPLVENDLWRFCRSDYCNIDPRYGTLEDFDTLVREAGRRNIKILYVHFCRTNPTLTTNYATCRMDLVVNHTSDEVGGKLLPTRTRF